MGGRGRRRSQARGIESRQGTFGGEPVFKGTRIPLAAVCRFIARGATDVEIMAAYRDLNTADIDMARRAFTAEREA